MSTRFCVICVVFFFLSIHAHLTSVSLRARVFFCLLLERLYEVRSRTRFVKCVALGRNSPAACSLSTQVFPHPLLRRPREHQLLGLVVPCFYDRVPQDDERVLHGGGRECINTQKCSSDECFSGCVVFQRRRRGSNRCSPVAPFFLRGVRRVRVLCRDCQTVRHVPSTGLMESLIAHPILALHLSIVRR